MICSGDIVAGERQLARSHRDAGLLEHAASPKSLGSSALHGSSKVGRCTSRGSPPCLVREIGRAAHFGHNPRDQSKYPPPPVLGGSRWS